jgi:hypothetical protein
MTAGVLTNAQAQAINVSLTKTVNISEYVNIQKLIAAHAVVYGNSALANAGADATGSSNTVAQTLTTTSVVQGVGSAAYSESVSATNGSYSYMW